MFSEKTFLITGASSGLGRALAVALSQQNAQLVLMARDENALIETVQQCSLSHRPVIVVGDVSQAADCQRAVNTVISHFGNLDYLLLNAGISMWANFSELTDLSVISQLTATNYMGTIYCTHYALPYLKKTHGLIAVISSIQGKIGVPFHTGYAGSKHALQGFFDSLRMELKHQVDVLLVCPGWIKDTALKQRAIGNKPVRERQHKKSALTLDRCVKDILKAMTKRQRELIIPRFYRFVPLLKALCPRFLDYLIGKNVHQE